MRVSTAPSGRVSHSADRAFAAGAAMIGDRVVIATDTRTNQADVIGVTFWISEGP